jgi:MFS family permease
MSAAAAGRIILRYGFRKTARLGAALVLLGLAGLLAGALLDAGVAWISAACGLIGAGLGPSSMSQVLATQYTAPERQRGIATSLVPFFRTVGGSLGVGALGGILASGLASRLHGGADTAGRLLAGRPEAGAALPVAPALFRQAIERSLLPVFAVLLALAVVNLFVASGFPAEAGVSDRAPTPAEGLA